MLYHIVKSLIKPFLIIFYRVRVKGIENIPENDGCILCSNHNHWLDPVVVACFTKRQVHYMAKKELFKNKLLGYLIKKVGTFPVNRGAADISAIKKAIKLVKSNKVLGIFPEGTRVKVGSSIPAEPGIAMIGVKGKSKIVPIGISSTYKLGAPLIVNIGQPITLEEYYGKKNNIEDFKKISENIMAEVRQLIMNT